ncbi:MAG: D-alanyl-D-alanine carboxypeptidase, partial [Epulopiscium sp.]|nr:D-alanyl-D-alanine carboxypeptidase [Candidatus Epulonipiscium sp.]
MKTIIRRVLATFLVGMMLFPQMTFAAQKPEVTAETAILMEPTTGKIIYSKDIHKKMYPASMTKILTALVVMDYFSPDTLITVGTEINEVTLDSSKAGHKRGETLTVENLIRGLIIPSGNDTANVLAAAVAKKVENNNDLTPEESEKVFARLMNEKAKKLGAKESHFSNAHGYHDENHYTSAYDMALITREAQKNKMISEIAKEKSFSGKGVENNLESSSN